MSDAVKVGFVPFSNAARGILVVFCDDTLKFGDAARKALGAAAAMVGRVASANQFKGKSGSALDILAPQGLKSSRLIVVGSASFRPSRRMIFSSSAAWSRASCTPAARP